MNKFRYLERGEEIPRQMRFRAFLGCQEIMELVPQGAAMLDIGGGDGLHARYFRRHGLEVDILDLREGMEPLVYAGEYEKFKAIRHYDVVWCSHVYEHIINPGLFMDKIYSDLKPGGYIAITVPPMKSEMLFEHVTLWNPGLLLIHLIKAGFDCRLARVGSYHYNITVIAQKPTERLNLSDSELLPAVERIGGYFNGDIKFLNWTHQKLIIDQAVHMAKEPLENLLRKLSTLENPPEFAYSQIPDPQRPAYMYVDVEKRFVCPVG